MNSKMENKLNFTGLVMVVCHGLVLREVILSEKVFIFKYYVQACDRHW